MRFFFFLVSVCVLFFFGAHASLAQDEPRPMSAVDMVEMPRLGAAALSPDGSKLLYRRSETNWDENRIVRRYRLIDVETGESLPLFEPEDDKESYGSAHWAPDNSGFITLLERDDDEHRQAYFYYLKKQELVRLTNHPEDVERVFWAPDGSSFYFQAERPRSKETDKFLDDDWIIEPYETRHKDDVWRFDVSTGETSPVVVRDGFIRNYRLSRDGKSIIYHESEGGLSDERHAGDLWLHDIASGERQRLTQNAYYEAAPKVSPKNTHFAFVAIVNEDGDFYYEANLFVQKIGENEPRLLFPDTPLEVVAYEWDASGDGLYVISNIGVRTELFYYKLADSTLTRLTEGDHVLTGWSYDPDLDVHTTLIRSAADPGEVYIMRDLSEGFQKVTSEYDDLRAQFLLPKQEAVSWRGRGGVDIEGLLVYPIGYSEGERFPLVTITHGGPRSSSQFGSWNISRYIPVLAGQGYGVLLPNHRGGTGYGDDFMRDMLDGYFTNSHDDTLRGVDHLIDIGLADPDRLIKMGWSAGGHMTNKVITITDRFAAASSGAGASDWVSMYAESDVRFTRTPLFGGAPWEKNAPLKVFRKHSTLQDAWRVKTPTLFFVGGNDVRVPTSQSIMKYRGVKAAGAETELYIARGQPHNYRLPSFQLFKINKELEWYARHALDAVYEPVLPPEAHETEE